jgi:hypothetical protein
MIEATGQAYPMNIRDISAIDTKPSGMVIFHGQMGPIRKVYTIGHNINVKVSQQLLSIRLESTSGIAKSDHRFSKVIINVARSRSYFV